MVYGMLSGAQIAEAVERHKRFIELTYQHAISRNFLHRWLIRRERRKLEGLPRIHIDDFNTTKSHEGGRLNPNSYNLTLGSELLVYDVPAIPPDVLHCLNLDRLGIDNDLHEYAIDMRKSMPTKTITIPADGLILKPGRLYLGKTVEYTETYNLVPVLDGRSSVGRLGMAVHITAGFGDNFYKGHWTLELFVVQPLKIYSKVQVAQIRYHTVGKGWPYNGKYNNVVGASAEPSKLWSELQKQ
jgi:dCTP deaminase